MAFSRRRELAVRARNSSIRVDGKTNYATSKHPRTGESQTFTLTICVFTAKNFVVDDHGARLTMERARVNANALLIVSALIELGAGAVLLAMPSVAAELLLGEGLSTPSSILMARIAGGALASIAVTCALGRGSDRRAQTNIIAGLLTYNIAVAAVLGAGWGTLTPIGVLFWPAIVLHVVLAVWCLVCVRHSRA